MTTNESKHTTSTKSTRNTSTPKPTHNPSTTATEPLRNPSPFASPHAALAAGTDTADDLTALELALSAAIEEEDPIDPERRQAALRAIARHLAAHAARLHDIFAYLWQHPKGA